MFVCCFDLPNNTFKYPPVHETTKLRLASQNLPEVVEGDLIIIVDMDENISPGENPIFAILLKNTSLQDCV